MSRSWRVSWTSRSRFSSLPKASISAVDRLATGLLLGDALVEHSQLLQDFAVPCVAVDQVPSATSLPGLLRRGQGLAGRGALQDAGLDGGHLLLPALQVGRRLLGRLALRVLGGAVRLLLLEFVVESGQRGDRVEDAGRAELVERLGEQVGGRADDRTEVDRNETQRT